MEDVLELGHFDGAAHVLRAFVDKFVLANAQITVLVGVADRLDIGLDFAVNNAAHLLEMGFPYWIWQLTMRVVAFKASRMAWPPSWPIRFLDRSMCVSVES